MRRLRRCCRTARTRSCRSCATSRSSTSWTKGTRRSSTRRWSVQRTKTRALSPFCTKKSTLWFCTSILNTTSRWNCPESWRNQMSTALSKRTAFRNTRTVRKAATPTASKWTSWTVIIPIFLFTCASLNKIGKMRQSSSNHNDQIVKLLVFISVK